MEGPYQPPLNPGSPPPMMPGPPPLPRGPLWICLLLPPGFIGAATALCMALDRAHVLATNNWIVQGLILLWIVIAIGCAVRFGNLMARRFTSGSAVLLILGYLVGQAVVCFAVFFGCCLVMIGGGKF